jgi:hypothetical protein
VRALATVIPEPDHCGSSTRAPAQADRDSGSKILIRKRPLSSFPGCRDLSTRENALSSGVASLGADARRAGALDPF